MVGSKLLNEDCLHTISKLRWEHVRDSRKTKHHVEDVIVKGKNKGAIFTNQKIVDKVQLVLI